MFPFPSSLPLFFLPALYLLPLSSYLLLFLLPTCLFPPSSSFVSPHPFLSLHPSSSLLLAPLYHQWSLLADLYHKEGDTTKYNPPPSGGNYKE